MNRLLLQHGLNLGFAGLWSFLVAYVVYRQDASMAGLYRYSWLLSSVVLMVDWGYFIAVDIPSLGEAMGEAQTFICSIGSVLITYDVYKKGKISSGEARLCYAASLCLTVAGTVNLALKLGNMKGSIKSEL